MAKDWIKHVSSGHEDDKGRSLCGRDVSLTWHFLDPTHAFLNARSGGRLVMCKRCRAVITKVFQSEP